MALCLSVWLSMLCLFGHASPQSSGFDAREATIASVHHDLYRGLTTCRAVVSSFLSRIEAINGRINAIISLNPGALAIADELDEALITGNATGALFCVPTLVKDNTNTADMKTTGGSLALAGSQPSSDAAIVQALRRAGAVILGKANLHELALEGLTVSSLGGQTINPYDCTRTPGGSSGGSAAAVAASLAVWATGSDTFNSLRSPASANSLFSCRPTRGLISRAGVIGLSYSQDTVGPIARTTSDVATALTVMASIGWDALDNVTARIPKSSIGVDYNAVLTVGSIKGVRLGLVEGLFDRTSSNETTPVNEAMAAMVGRLRAEGVIVVSINETIYNATAISNALDTQRYEIRQLVDTYLQDPQLGGSHPTTLNELWSGESFLVIPAQHKYATTALVSSTSNATYNGVQAGVMNLTLALQETFARNNLDALIYPEQKNLVVKIGAASQHGRNGILAALTGSPVVTVPVGFSPPSADAPIGIPMGMEILGTPWSEQHLLQIAYQIEHLTRIRRMPVMAQVMVEAHIFMEVPVLVPDASNIPAAYPIGVI